ncbi:MAG: CvpA family protein [Formivibrio sp.]|nr:CvpA family protein [Formivibrio sp.]
MTVFDYVVLAIVGLSILLSVMRGLMQEILALAAWVLSFWLASKFAGQGMHWMPDGLPNDSIRYVAAFLAIFCAVWLLSAIIRVTINQFLNTTGLKPLDRMLGAVFGFSRGVLLVLMLVLVAGMTHFPQTPDWRNAMFSPLCENAALHIKPWLPVGLANRIHFD